MSGIKRFTLETATSDYTVSEIIGEGGSGRVYGAHATDGSQCAIKIIPKDKASDDKRKRFKNELNFLARNQHARIVSVIDSGMAHTGRVTGPFYVMRRYTGSLRDKIGDGSPDENLATFAAILDGVEAAHLQGVVHRDLKPENVLVDGKDVAVADFGVARFQDEALLTAVDTGPGQRLANFLYAAPEQRVRGAIIDERADIYALGLMLHEMLTGEVPLGKGHATVASRHPALAYVDRVVEAMLSHSPANRPATIADVKGLLARNHSEFEARQRLSAIKKIVVPEGAIDNPLAHDPPRLVDVDWNDGVLTLHLDRDVDRGWNDVLRSRLGSYSNVMGIPPGLFDFQGRTARVSVPERSVQNVINHLKQWLPQATAVYRMELEAQAKRRAEEHRRALAAERARIESRQRILSNIQL